MQTQNRNARRINDVYRGIADIVVDPVSGASPISSCNHITAMTAPVRPDRSSGLEDRRSCDVVVVDQPVEETAAVEKTDFVHLERGHR